MIDECTRSACGKVLLFGEHAVVHGQPALALGLPEGARATARRTGGATNTSILRAPAWELELSVGDDEPLARAFAALLAALAPREATDDLPGVEVTTSLALPSGVGLGSSAAIGIAAARACVVLTTGEDAPLERLIELGYAWEGVFHGTPSGIDHTAAARGGVFTFERTAAGPEIRGVALAAPLHLVVAVAGPASSTREMVASVTERVKRHTDARDAVSEIGDIVREAVSLLRQDSNDRARRLGALMDRNHELLDLLGVSTPALDAACARARSAGALGAKVTGAGGGGCILAIAADAERAEAVAESLRASCDDVLTRTLEPEAT